MSEQRTETITLRRGRTNETERVQRIGTLRMQEARPSLEEVEQAHRRKAAALGKSFWGYLFVLVCLIGLTVLLAPLIFGGDSFLRDHVDSTVLNMLDEGYYFFGILIVLMLAAGFVAFASIRRYKTPAAFAAAFWPGAYFFRPEVKSKKRFYFFMGSQLSDTAESVTCYAPSGTLLWPEKTMRSKITALLPCRFELDSAQIQSFSRIFEKDIRDAFAACGYAGPWQEVAPKPQIKDAQIKERTGNVALVEITLPLYARFGGGALASARQSTLLDMVVSIYLVETKKRWRPVRALPVFVEEYTQVSQDVQEEKAAAK